jgi:hypothetical protein
MESHAAMNNNDGLESLQVLVGEPVTSIVLIHDYLQVVFHDGTLNFYAWPAIRLDTDRFELDAARYEKELHFLIDQRVKAIGRLSDTGLKIEFESSVLEFDPVDEDLSGPEIMDFFNTREQRPEVWTYGSPPFERIES